MKGKYPKYYILKASCRQDLNAEQLGIGPLPSSLNAI